MGSGIRRLGKLCAALGVVGVLAIVAACGERGGEPSGEAGGAGAAGSSAAGNGGLAGGATIVISAAGNAGAAGGPSECYGQRGAWPDPEQVADSLEVAGTATVAWLRHTANCEGGTFSITAEYSGSTETFPIPVPGSRYVPGLANCDGTFGPELNINAVTSDSKRAIWLTFYSSWSRLKIGDVCGSGAQWTLAQPAVGLSLDDLAEGDWLEFEVTLSSPEVDLKRVHGTVCVNYVEQLPL